jgi:hypothetical protein
MKRVQMNLRVPEEIKEWLYSEAAKDDRDPGYYLTNLIKTKIMKKAPEKKQAVPAKVEASLDLSSWPYAPSEQIFKDWIKAKKAAKGSISQTAINTVGKELHKAVLAGHTVDDCLSVAENGKWKGFKAEWMKSNTLSHNAAQCHTNTQSQDFTGKHTDKSWADGL